MSIRPEFMDLRTLSEYICASESWIENAVKQGKFPAPKKVMGKRFWRWKEIEKHLARGDDLSAASPSDELRRITDATRQAAASRNH